MLATVPSRADFSSSALLFGPAEKPSPTNESKLVMTESPMENPS
jgi:hypothetical protein